MAIKNGRSGMGRKEVSSRRPTQAFGNQDTSFQSEQAKAHSQKAGAVRSKRISGAQRSAQQRQQKRRDSR
ncbi:MAG TPA: hypothetical protein VGK67_32190 [Myxococcales bacterium]